MLNRLILLLPALPLLAACESGTLRALELTLSPEIQARYSPEAPGVVMSDLTGTAQPWVVLCGQALRQPLFLSHDEGFGCLDDGTEGAEVPVRVWIEPVATQAFTCSSQRESYDSMGSPPDAGGPALSAAPQEGWPQATVTATWRRDVSPCGGILKGTATLGQ